MHRKVKLFMTRPILMLQLLKEMLVLQTNEKKSYFGDNKLRIFF